MKTKYKIMFANMDYYEFAECTIIASNRYFLLFSIVFIAIEIGGIVLWTFYDIFYHSV